MNEKEAAKVSGWFVTRNTFYFTLIDEGYYATFCVKKRKGNI